MQTHYPPMAKSPATTITSGINNTDTTIPVADLAKVPAAPNLITLGTDETAEVVLYTGKSGSSGAGNLTGCTRGVVGTAISWATGSAVARVLSSYDLTAIQTDIAGIAAAKRTIFLSCAGGWSSYTSPDYGLETIETATNKVNFRGTKFPASANNMYHEHSLTMPKNYNGGAITAKPYFRSAGAATSGTVIFGLQGRSYGDGETLDQAFGTAQESTTTLSVTIAGLLRIGAATPAITLAGSPAGEEYVQFRTYRLGSDTCANDITLLGWLISYTTNNYSDE